MKKIISFAILVLINFGYSYSQITFTNSTDLLPNTLHSDHPIGVADMNGDGLDDVVQIDHNSLIYYSFQGEPNAPFTYDFVYDMLAEDGGSANTWGLAIGDLNNDGINELIAGGYYNGIFIISGQDNSYTSNVIAEGQIFVQGINTFDIDNDGLLDIFACDDNEVSEIHLNNGDGSYSYDQDILYPVTDLESDDSGNYGSLFTDIDNNGHFDLYIAKCRQGVTEPENPVRINLAYMNDGEGNWTSEGAQRGLASGAQSWIGDFGDFDNDGDLDLIVGNHDVDSRFYLNDGSGNFTDKTVQVGLDGAFSFLTIQGSFVDFDNDGYLDFIMTGGENAYIAMNNGQGGFDMEYDLLPAQINSMALGDLNHDGFIDVVTTGGGYGGWNNTQEDQLFLNDGNDNNFISVNLTGVSSNSNGVGARVTITGPWGTQIRDVKSGQSYGIQHSFTQHFGVGQYTIIDQLTVAWPSGTVDTYTNVDANHFYSVSEGGEIVAGIDDIKKASHHLTLFPNPTTDYIEISTSPLTDSSIKIYDMQGRLVLSKRQVYNKIDVRSWANGTYSYQIFDSNGTVFSGSFIKE